MTGTQTDPIWGIDGTQFLWGYWILVALLALALAWQVQRLRGARGDEQVDLCDQDLYELALLADGEQLAITSAATQLHYHGLLGAGPAGGTLVATGELGADAGPLERAVFEAVEAQPGISAAQLRERVSDSDAMRSMREALTSEGLLIERDARATLTGRMLLAGAVLMLLAIARGIAGVSEGHPIGYLAVTVGALLIGTIWAVGRLPSATARGSRRVKRWREENAALRESPGLSNGAAAVALFGGAALWLAAPEFASALGVERESSGWSGGGGGGGCGGGCGGCGGCGG